MRCLTCDYDLRRLPENRCPECGQPFDPADPATVGGRDLMIVARTAKTFAFILATYPIAVLASVYLLWFSARLTLGHWPQMYTNDPKFIGGIVSVFYLTTGLLFMLALPALVAGVAVVVPAAIVSVLLRRNLFGRAAVLPVLAVLTWVGMIWWLRNEPHRIVCWFLD